MQDLWDPRVAAVRAAAPYPATPPFAPPRRFPEFPWPGDEPWDPENRVYPAVRRLLRALGLDAARFDTPRWNPLGDLIRPGDRVLLKPNYILHQHLSGLDLFSVITHPAVIRCVLDYVALALGGTGRIVVADAPQANARWDLLVARSGIAATLEALRARHGLAVELRDLRALRVTQRHGITLERDTGPGEAVLVDLGEESALAPLRPTLVNLCGSDYDRHNTVRHHTGGHRYAAARSVLEADVLISLPKLKVHKKTGVSLNLKNMVGINADKNHIPHYRVGDALSGGDEFPPAAGRLGRLADRLSRLAIDVLLGRLDRYTAPVLSRLAGAVHRASTGRCPLDASDAGHNQAVIRLVYRRLLGKEIRAGNWPGNDTLWRAILDLNRIALYANPEGRLLAAPARRYLSIIDGVVGGEGEGPMDPTPVAAGLLVGGYNPVLVDVAAARCMGLDPTRIQLLHEALKAQGTHPLVAAGARPALDAEADPASLAPFAAPAGWRDHLRHEASA